MNSTIFVDPDGTAWVVPRLMGGSGGGARPPQIVTQATSKSPWGPQAPYLEEGFEAAKEQFEGPRPSYFPGSTVTPFAPETEEALGIRTAQARDPGGLIGGAEQQLGQTLAGDYLQPDNPVYQQMLQGITSSVRPGVDTSFARAGRYGSPLHTEALGRGISAGMMPFIGQERSRQLGAAQAAPQFAAVRPGILSGIGAQRESLGGAQLQDRIARHDFEQNLPAQKLGQYMANISGGYGGTGLSQTQRPTYSNPLMTGLGAGAGLASIGQSLFEPKGGGGIFGKG